MIRKNVYIAVTRISLICNIAAATALGVLIGDRLNFSPVAMGLLTGLPMAAIAVYWEDQNA